MRILLALLLTATLVACGDADADTQPPPEEPAAEATPEAAESFDPLTPPAQAASPAGSAGTFSFLYVRGSGDTRDTTRIEGFLPPPMPRDAAGSTALNAVPIYEVSVMPSSVTADIDLNRSGYLYITVDEVGEVEARVRSGRSTLGERHEGLFRGTAYAVSFPPVWDAAGSTPRLQIRDDENEETVLGELALPVADAPVWAQPLTLPTVPKDTRLTFSADMTLNDPELVPILVYPSTFGTVGWRAQAFEVDSFEARSRERAGTTDLGTPYKVFTGHHDEANPEAFIILFRP